ncbi:MAG: radical SAM protein [Sulfolobales archaeon]|nr:radical SAM protein [Sulfolobales archaeon]MCX8186056.1 radical SAM protein [Sulfolobales archaeon]MDW7969351.1 radical SAM protein [Sulfolobales archaeon]
MEGGNGADGLIHPSRYDANRKVISIGDREVHVGSNPPKVLPQESLLRYTQSICPYCYALLPAVLVERDSKVYIKKVCPEHGEIEELYSGDAEFFKKLESWYVEGRGPRHVYTDLSAPCPYSCGLCSIHKSHTALANMVLTNRCDLDCWYCFFYAEKVGFVYEPTLKQIEFMVKNLLKQGVTAAIQLTGGEPLIRDDIVEIIRLLKSLGVKHVQLNTNGIKFARLYMEDPSKAIEFAKSIRSAGVNTIYLSFDGVTPKTNPKNHWEVPYIFEVFRKSGITSVVLVPVIIKNVNDGELGEIIKFAALNMDVVRAVNFQPVSLTGMIKRAERERMRITVADAVKKIEELTKGSISREDWFTVPSTVPISEFAEVLEGRFKFEMSNHPQCGVGTYVYVRKEGDDVTYTPITRMIDVPGFLEYLRDKAGESAGKGKLILGSKVLLNLIGKFIKWGEIPSEIKTALPKMLYDIFTKRDYHALGVWHYKFLFIGMMHFMDLYNYDVQRVMRCNIHYLMPDGRLIPFCTFNVLNDVYRDYVQKKYMSTIEDWVRESGKELSVEKYRRNLSVIEKLESSELYKVTYGPFINK